MKDVKACLSAREDRVSSFHCFGGPVRLMQACFICGKDRITPFSPPRKYFEARAGLFKCQSRSRKQFSTM